MRLLSTCVATLRLSSGAYRRTNDSVHFTRVECTPRLSRVRITAGSKMLTVSDMRLSVLGMGMGIPLTMFQRSTW
jgi:hypothetical protein